MLASTSSSTPSGFGEVTVCAGIPGKEVAQWSLQDALAYVDVIELGRMSSTISTQGIDGCMLVELVGSSTDLQELGFSRFQSKKVKQRLPHLDDL